MSHEEEIGHFQEAEGGYVSDNVRTLLGQVLMQVQVLAVVKGCKFQVQLFSCRARARSNPGFNSSHFKQTSCLNCDCEHLPAESHQR